MQRLFSLTDWHYEVPWETSTFSGSLTIDCLVSLSLVFELFFFFFCLLNFTVFYNLWVKYVNKTNKATRPTKGLLKCISLRLLFKYHRARIDWKVLTSSMRKPMEIYNNLWERKSKLVDLVTLRFTSSKSEYTWCQSSFSSNEGCFMK